MANLDTAIWLLSVAAEAILFAVLIYRQVRLRFPVFTLYIFWSLASNIAGFWIYRNFSTFYVAAYTTLIIVDSAMEIWILVELASSVFRTCRFSLPRAAPVTSAVFILCVGIAIWPFTGLPGLSHTPPEYHFFVRLRQDTATLRVLFLLELAGFSQVFSLDWRDRELQIATGMGFFSLVSLAVEMILSHIPLGPLYSHLNRIVICSYSISLLYWIFSFAQKDPERRRGFTAGFDMHQRIRL